METENKKQQTKATAGQNRGNWQTCPKCGCYADTRTHIGTACRRNFTNEEFRDRIRQIVGIGSEEIIDAKRSDPCVVRRPADKGFNPPTTNQDEKSAA